MKEGKSSTNSTTSRPSRKREERLKIDDETPSVGVVSQLMGTTPLPRTNSVSLDRIILPSSQPRRYFDPDKQQQLVESIKREGILQPLLVRPLGSESDHFELVAGERRFRAAQAVGLTEVPVVVREMTDDQARQYALVENLQRLDLNPVEETEGILALLEMKLETSREQVISLLNKMSNVQRGITDNVIRNEEREVIDEVFAAVGRFTPESFRVNRLPLLNLPEDLLETLRAGQIEYTKAKAIAQVKDESSRRQLLSDVIDQGLPLTQIKEQVKALKGSDPTKEPPGQEDLRKRMNSLGKLSKSSNAMDDPQVRQKVNKLVEQLEKLLK